MQIKAIQNATDSPAPASPSPGTLRGIVLPWLAGVAGSAIGFLLGAGLLQFAASFLPASPPDWGPIDPERGKALAGFWKLLALMLPLLCSLGAYLWAAWLPPQAQPPQRKTVAALLFPLWFLLQIAMQDLTFVICSRTWFPERVPKSLSMLGDQLMHPDRMPPITTISASGRRHYNGQRFAFDDAGVWVLSIVMTGVVVVGTLQDRESPP